MDNLFFIISKLAWALVSPGNLLVILFILATGFLLLGWQVWAKRLMVLSSIWPLASWLTQWVSF